MKKIRIETKSGELVKEFEGEYTPELIYNNEGGGPEVMNTNYITNFLGLIVKEIEVEEKKPVVRWLWFHDVDEDNKYFLSGKFYTEEEAAEADKTRKAKFYKKLEWSRTEFP